MVRPLALVSVGEKHDEGRALVPLLLTRGNELVDDRLCAVDEVAELRLPHDESVGTGDGVAVLEPERSEFAQQGVVDPQLCAVAVAALERLVLPARGLIDDHGVAVAERAAAGVLPGEAHGPTLEEQRTDGERLAHAPVDCVIRHHLRPALQLGRESRVHGEALGHDEL